MDGWFAGDCGRCGAWGDGLGLSGVAGFCIGVAASPRRFLSLQCGFAVASL